MLQPSPIPTPYAHTKAVEEEEKKTQKKDYYTKNKKSKNLVQQVAK